LVDDGGAARVDSLKIPRLIFSRRSGLDIIQIIA
jgi:hypothetical protein